MSNLKNFLNKLWAGVKKAFEGLKAELQQAVHYGVIITEAVKNFDENNHMAVDILTAIIPGDWDDALKAKMRIALPNIVVELKLVDATKGLTDPNEIMLAAVGVIKQLDGDYSSAFLHSFAILSAQVAADGKLDWSDAVLLLQWYYEHKHKA